VSYTKATLADVTASQATTAAAGSAASESAQRGTALSAETEAGIEQVTAVLLQHVRTLADALRQHASATGAQLAATDWEGRAREAALAAERTLHARVDATTAAAEDGTVALRQALTAAARDLVALVQQDVAAVLGSLHAAYHDLAAAQGAFADGLASVDAAARF